MKQYFQKQVMLHGYIMYMLQKMYWYFILCISINPGIRKRNKRNTKFTGHNN